MGREGHGDAVGGYAFKQFVGINVFWIVTNRNHGAVYKADTRTSFEGV